MEQAPPQLTWKALRAAGQAFREFGLDRVAEDEPLPIEVLSGYAAEGRAWVAVGPRDFPVGYILVDVVDGAAHVEQVSVLADHQGRGVGRTLMYEARSLRNVPVGEPNGPSVATGRVWQHVEGFGREW